MEIWKPVKGYEQYYEVSNFERIRSLDRISITKAGWGIRKHGTVLKLRNINNSGYMTVGLHDSGKAKAVLVHRLVAEAFCDNVYGLDEVNHIDENKLNNSVGNLEWCTHKQNVNHGDEIERGARKQRIAFHQIDFNGNIVKTYYGFKKAQREHGLDRKAISECCNGKRESYLGYKWEYAEESA